MKNKTNIKKYLALATAFTAFLLVVAPQVSSAATYAYVNQSGDVATVTANDPYVAIKNAPAIHVHSGVLLLKDASDYTDLGV